VLALAPLCGLVAPPIIGLLADARRARVWLLRGLSAGAVLAFLGFFVAAGRAAIYATAFVFAACRSPVVALVDACAVETARAAGASYGRLRVWGSLAFCAAALVGAEIADRSGPREVFAVAALALAVAAAMAWRIPTAKATRVQLTSALQLAALWPFAAATALAGLANATYDAGFSLHLARIGLGGRFVGWAWGLGVLAEVGLMAVSGRIVQRMGAERLLTAAIAVGALRWAALAFVRAPAAILALAPLHGITFGMFWVAGVTTAHRHAAPDAPTAAQGLFVASSSLGSVIPMAASGSVLEAWGGTGLFLGAAAAALAGTACAAGFARRAC
jgi:PPP family 3-phenylpropionic acid transporter